MTRRPRAIAVVSPELFSSSPREPLEILSQLAGNTSFKVPTVGRGTRGGLGGIDDIAHALGLVVDPLDQRLALAIACQTAAEWPAIQTLAVPRILEQLRGGHTTRGLVEGYRRHRVRLVLYDVFHDLVLLRPRRPWLEAAAAVRMKREVYTALYEVMVKFIHTQAQAGAFEACRILFSRRGT